MKPLIKGSLLVTGGGEAISGGVTIEGPLPLKRRQVNKRLKREFKQLRKEMMKELRK